MQVVEHDQVQTPVGCGVALDVGLDRSGGKQRALGALDRNVDERERGDFLRPAVLEHLEIVEREIGDRVALGIGDHRVHLDVVHFDAEGQRRLIRRRLLGRLRLGTGRWWRGGCLWRDGLLARAGGHGASEGKHGSNE